LKKMTMQHNLKIAMISASLVVLFIGAGQVFADFSNADWRYVKSIGLPSDLTAGGLVEVVPDAEVYANANPGLTDLRVISNDKFETPYKFEVSRGSNERVLVPTKLIDSGHVPGKHTTFTADLGRNGILHNEIAFRTSSRNFNLTATIETSKDGELWVNVGEHPVYDLSVEGIGRVSRNTRLTYNESSARFIRIRIADQGDGELEVNGTTVSLEKSTLPIETRWPASILRVTQNSELSATLVEVDLGAAGLPSHRLALQIPNINFHRRVNVETSGDLNSWRSLASGSAIYSYSLPKFTGSDLNISYPETTARYLRILIFNQDNAPLDVLGVETWGLQRRLVFAAEPTRDYRLFYGNREGRQPSYDIEMMFPYLDTRSILKASLGGHTLSDLYQPPVPPIPKPVPLTERLPWLLPLVIGFAATMVGLLLFVVVRRAKTLLPPPV
jgi:hypothetical protein